MTRLESAERLEKLESDLESATGEEGRVKARLRASEDEATSLRSHLASSWAEKERLESDLGSASNENASLRSRLQTALTEAERLGADLETIREDRVRLEGRLAEVQADSSRRIAEQDSRLAQSLGELEAMRAEFVRFTNLRLFRYTAPLRMLYSYIRRALGLTGD